MYELAPVLVVAVLAALLGGATGAGLAIRWLSRQRWRFGASFTGIEPPDAPGTVEYLGRVYAVPSDDEPDLDGEPPVP